MNRSVCLILLAAIVHAGLLAQPAEAERPLNVILMIGDGMGLSQVSSPYYDSLDMNKEPVFSQFKYIGLQKTSSGSHAVTQSAAAATAMGTGYKTYNLAIGMDMDTIPRENIVEIVSEMGYKTGIVVSSYLTDATPAGFYAHQPDRYMYREIGRDLVASEVDYFAGGGIKHFLDTTGVDLFGENNIEMNYSRLKRIKKPEPGKRYGFLLSSERMPAMLEGRKDFMETASENAIEFLSAEGQGYFLMIEGSQIDWAGHGNHVEYMRTEMADFESTVRRVMEIAEKDGSTLVIVTADHETGGFTLGASGDNRYGAEYDIVTPSFATTNHSATMVPVFAFGPGAENFMGVYENTEIFHKIISLVKGK